MMRRRGKFFKLGIPTFTLLVTAAAQAHNPVPTAATLTVNRDDRSLRIVIVHDALAFALGQTSQRCSNFDMLSLIEGSEIAQAAAFDAGRRRLMQELHLFADARPVEFEIASAPSVESLHQWKTAHPDGNPPCVLEFVINAPLPSEARKLTVQFPKIFDTVALIVQWSAGSAASGGAAAVKAPVTWPLRPAEVSPGIDVNAGTSDAGEGGQGASSESRDEMTWINVAWRFIHLGFQHIVPDGADHCLFVLGLFLLSPHVKAVLWQISSFTVAHTITLTLTSLGIIGLSGSIVEPAIAASIAFVAVENLCTTKVHGWRIVVAFAFGLVHGMGVATAFSDAGFPRGQLITSLAAFTVGVEAGHVAVLLAAFAALAWTRDKKWYGTRVRIPLSLAIAVIALYWVMQRTIGLG